MIVFSIIVYVVLAAWYFFGKAKEKRISMVIGICLSSFFDLWYVVDENWIAIIPYTMLGVLCVFLYWIAQNTEAALHEKKNKYIAALLSYFLGGIGIHKFYLKRYVLGLVYVLFAWTAVPTMIGMVEALYLLLIKKSYFDKKYNSRIETRSFVELRQELLRRKERLQRGADEILRAIREKTVIDVQIPQEHSQNSCPIETVEYMEAGETEEEDSKIEFRNVHTTAGDCSARGTSMDYMVTIYGRDNKRFDFRVVNGQIVSHKGPQENCEVQYSEVG